MTDELVFEEPPQRTQRSEHYTLLMALKQNPGRGFARVKVDLEEKDANRLAAQLRAAASKLGDGFTIIARWVPDTGKHGVWAKYDEAPGDQPPEEIAAKMNAEAMSVPVQAPTVPTSADVLQRGVVDEPAPWDGLPESPPLRVPEMPVGGTVPAIAGNEAEYAGKRTSAYGEPPF